MTPSTATEITSQIEQSINKLFWLRGENRSKEAKQLVSLIMPALESVNASFKCVQKCGANWVSLPIRFQNDKSSSFEKLIQKIQSIFRESGETVLCFWSPIFLKNKQGEFFCHIRSDIKTPPPLDHSSQFLRGDLRLPNGRSLYYFEKQTENLSAAFGLLNQTSSEYWLLESFYRIGRWMEAGLYNQLVLQYDWLARTPRPQGDPYLQTKRDVSQNLNALKAAEEVLAQEIRLPSGKVITREEFTSDPVFKATKEKHEVFSKLASLVKENAFDRQYQSFLEFSSEEHWYLPYENHPFQLAQLSLIAYLDKKIDLEELLITQSAAEAFLECYMNKAIIPAVQIHVLSAQTAEAYLSEAHFPPFYTPPQGSRFIPLVLHRETDLQQNKIHFLRRLEELSSIKRSVIEYKTSEKWRAHNNERTLGRGYFTVEAAIHYVTLVEEGFKYEIKDGKTRPSAICLLPLTVRLLLCQSLTHLTPPSEHKIMFGHSQELSSLFKGRPITGASPLFAAPYVHNLKEGSSGLGILFHDTHYHLPLDYNNPYVALLTSIGKEIWRKGGKKEINELAVYLMDRDAQEFRYKRSRTIGFWDFISKHIEKSFEKNNTAEQDLQTVVLPAIFRQIEKEEKESRKKLLDALDYLSSNQEIRKPLFFDLLLNYFNEMEIP